MNEKNGIRKLERLLMQVQHLAIAPSKSMRRVDVSAFSALQVLEVSGISVQCLENHVSLRSQLKSFRFEKHRLDSVASLLAPGLAPMLPSIRKRQGQGGGGGGGDDDAEEGGRDTIVAVHGKNSYFANRVDSSGGMIPFPKSIDGSVNTTPSLDGKNALEPRTEEDEEEEWKIFQWHKLYKLVLNECELSTGLSDGMLRLAWQVRVVELRNNSLTTVEKIFHHCEMLEHLDLSHNLLKSLPMLHLT
jgi:hypothetical protein